MNDNSLELLDKITELCEDYTISTRELVIECLIGAVIRMRLLSDRGALDSTLAMIRKSVEETERMDREEPR
jgi:hypothetical protein